MREGLAFVTKLHTALPLSYFSVFRTCMRRRGCFPRALSSCISVHWQFAPKLWTSSLSDALAFLFHIFFLVSKRTRGDDNLGVHSTEKKPGGQDRHDRCTPAWPVWHLEVSGHRSDYFTQFGLFLWSDSIVKIHSSVFWSHLQKQKSFNLAW